MNIKLKKSFKITTIALGVILPASFLGIGLSTDRTDNPTNGKDVYYSTKKNKENLIEIFSDGLDYRYLKNLVINNKNFKDFALIRQYATQGKSTVYSVPIIFGSYKTYNYWKILKKNNIFNNKDQYGDLVNSKISAETMVKHMNELNDNIDFKKTVIHPVNASQDTSPNSNTVGDYKAINKRDRSINVVNWSQARDKIAKNGWGIKELSASGFAYEYSTKFAKKANNDVPARVLINDMLTHKRYLDSHTKGLDLLGGNKAKSYEALQNYWINYFNKLKTIKNSDGISAYDNSMIVIYGDHANHNSYDGTGKVGDVLNKEHSFLMVKYPHFNNPNTNPVSLNETSVFGADIKHIIRNYFLNKNQYVDDNSANPNNNKIFDFLKTNSNFKKDKLMINTYGYVMQFNNEHQLIKLRFDKRSEKEDFDPSQLKEYWGWN